MPEALNLGNTQPVDANEGAVGYLDRQTGNRKYGQQVFLSGSLRDIPVSLGGVGWSGWETLTVSTTALQITEALRDNDRVFIAVESQAVRIRIDGGIPTATVGIEVNPRDTIELEGKEEVENFRAIRKDGSDSTLRVSVGMRIS